jgi:hypothetical protein
MRLIDADLLVKYFTENSTDLQGSEWFITNILDAINSAPAVSGEAVGIVTGLSIAGNPREFEWYKPVRLGEKLHLAPPQPQSVKDAFRMGILYISKKYELHRDEYFTGGDVADFLFMEEKELDDSDIESEIRKLIEEK